MQGIPLRPIMDTPFVENVHLSVSGRAFRISSVSAFPRRVSPYRVFCMRLQELLLLCLIFRNSPCREVALDFVFAACVGRTIIVIHGYNNVITVFLNAWKCTDLIQAAFPCLLRMSYDGQEIPHRSQLLHNG